MHYPYPILTASILKTLRGSDGNTFKKRLSYQLKIGSLVKLRKGLYIQQYARYTLTQSDHAVIANSIYIPSYVSYETVLRQHGVIFQYYERIYIASRYTIDIDIPINDIYTLHICSHAMPIELVSDPLGTISQDGYTCASLERAICDVLWRAPNYAFDIIDVTLINIGLLMQIGHIYSLYKISFTHTLSIFCHRYDLSSTNGT